MRKILHEEFWRVVQAHVSKDEYTAMVSAFRGEKTETDIDDVEKRYWRLLKRTRARSTSVKLADKIVMRSIDSLIPYASNPRSHSDAQIAQIAASIREFGFTNPVLVDGEQGIIAGHGRILAARKLGIDQIPTIELRRSVNSWGSALRMTGASGASRQRRSPNSRRRSGT
jgi:ParB-like nuclease family protein